MTTNAHRRGGLLLLSILVFGGFGLACSTLIPHPTASAPAGPAPASSGSLAILGSDGNIHILDVAAGHELALTDDAGSQADGGVVVYESPTWAGQTNRLAFVQTRIDASGRTSAAIVVVDSPGAPLKTAFKDPSLSPFYLYWSPDGQRLGFLASGGSGALSFLVQPTGRPARPLDHGQPYYWAWSPDGGSLLAHVGGAAGMAGQAGRLSLLQTGSGQKQDLAVAPGVFQAPAYSPDGKHVAVGASGPSGQTSLAILDSGGGVVGRLGLNAASVGFAWSPSGRKLAVVSLTAGSPHNFGELSLVDVSDLSSPRREATVADQVAAFFWSPDGGRLAYFVPDVASAPGQQQVSFPSQSGQLILKLFVEDAQGGSPSQVAAFPPTQAFLDQLPFFDQYQRSTTIWSPDSHQLVYAADTGGGRPGIFLVNADGSQPHRVADGVLGVWSWK